MDRRLKELNDEKEKLLKVHDTTLDTMRRTLNEKDKVNREKQAKLESRIQELERIQDNLKAGLLEASKPATGPGSKSPPTPPPPPPGPHRISQTQSADDDTNTFPAPPSTASIPPPPPPLPPPGMLGGGVPPPPPPPPIANHTLSPPVNDVMTIKKIYST
ncbi:unnamed protein product, partial [Anisakis simplex]